MNFENYKITLKQKLSRMNENYIASGPSQPPKVLASPPTSIAESLAIIVFFSAIVIF